VSGKRQQWPRDYTLGTRAVKVLLPIYALAV
jgi:hypothetical protein